MPIEIDPATGAPIVTPAAPVTTPTTSFVASTPSADDPSAIPPVASNTEGKDSAIPSSLDARIEDARKFNQSLPLKASAIVTSVQSALAPETIVHPDERVQQIHARMKEIRDEFGGQVSDIPVEKGGEYWVLRDELRALLNP